MALNYSHGPIIPSHLPEDNLVSPLRFPNGYFAENLQENIGDGFANPWHLDRDVEDSFDTGRERYDRVGSQDSVSSDILDLLPLDPFGMGSNSTVTAISGWLEDFDLVDYGWYWNNFGGLGVRDYPIFAELNYIGGNTLRLHTTNTSTEGIGNNKSSVVKSRIGWCSLGTGAGGVSNSVISGSACDGANMLSSKNTVGCGGAYPYEGLMVSSVEGSHEVEEESPHSALSFAFGYLGVRDLLSLQRVCRTFCSTIRNDPLLWRSICIDHPLREKISDDILLELTRRAQGNLRCLTLVECPLITDDGLKRVIESNPKLNKLFVPGCTRLSIDGVVDNLKALKSMGAAGVEYLRVGGLYNIKQHHYEELKKLLGMHDNLQYNDCNRHIFRSGKAYLSCHNDLPIDIEVCPRCEKVRLVFDCPAKGCQVKEYSTQICRACISCIPRCSSCGQCINNDVEYEETFLLELVCSDCKPEFPSKKVGE